MSKQTQNKKAGLYYRLSQEDERAGESLSIENQKKILEKYARENGFEIIDEYIDDGWSGTNFNRPGVQRLLEDAKNGRINVIIVKDLSHCRRRQCGFGCYRKHGNGYDANHECLQRMACRQHIKEDPRGH